MKKKFIIAFLLMAFVIPSVDFALAEQNKRDDNRPGFTMPIAGDIDPNDTVACADITRNLHYGSKDTETNHDVSILQDFLIERGDMRGMTTGFFGKATFTGVRSFQRANNIVATGYVGPVTRAKIKTIDCTTTTPENPTNPENPNNSQKAVVKKLVTLYPKGQIEECLYKRETVYRVEFDAVTETGGGTYATFNRKGELIHREDTPSAQTNTGATIRNVEQCKIVYLPAPNKYNRPKVDIYGVTPVINQNQTIALGTATKIYKDRTYVIADTNYKLTITGFYNHPCPPNAMCIWSGLDVFYKIDPISGKGPSYAKTEINQNTDGFPFTVSIKDSDYTNFAKVVVNMTGQNVSHIIDALPGSGDN